MKLDRLSDITSELSTNLVRSIVLPGGLLDWLTRPLPERIRDRFRQGLSGKAGDVAEPQRLQAAMGPIVLMGGVPVPDESIVAMIHLAGGRTARLAIIPAATTNHAQAAELGTKLFTRFGMRKLEVFDLITRERAESPEWVAKLAAFDAVFLCGDDENVGLEVLRGTLSARTLKDMLAAGKPIGGLGAGAAIMAERLVVRRGNEDTLTEGLGLAPGLLVDTHFTQENRFGRLARALHGEGAGNLLGVGLDAGAAVAVRDGEAKVLGDTSVTFLDLRESQPLADPANTALAGMKVHVLMDGFVMNLRSRRPYGAPSREPAPAAAAK
jgi:cyanophycinase